MRHPDLTFIPFASELSERVSFSLETILLRHGKSPPPIVSQVRVRVGACPTESVVKNFITPSRLLVPLLPSLRAIRNGSDPTVLKYTRHRPTSYDVYAKRPGPRVPGEITARVAGHLLRVGRGSSFGPINCNRRGRGISYLPFSECRLNKIRFALQSRSPAPRHERRSGEERPRKAPRAPEKLG